MMAWLGLCEYDMTLAFKPFINQALSMVHVHLNLFGDRKRIATGMREISVFFCDNLTITGFNLCSNEIRSHRFFSVRFDPTLCFLTKL
jgi:hypothetical protein